MFYWSIQILVISIVLILLVHHLLLFFKKTLTIPKVKDLVNTTTDKYDKIYGIVKGSQEEPQEHKEHKPPDDIQSMKNELRSFLYKNVLPSSPTGDSTMPDFTMLDQLPTTAI